MRDGCELYSGWGRGHVESRAHFLSGRDDSSQSRLECWVS